MGFQFSREIEPATTPPVEENAFKPPFVVGLPIWLKQCDTKCIRTVWPGYTLYVTPGVTSHNRKAIEALLLVEKI